MSRYSSGIYTRSPFDPAKWPLEAGPADRLYSEKTTNSGLVREMSDPAMLNASATYALSVVSLWYPWLLMGQQPGFQVWNANGLKLSSLDQIPAPTRKMFEKLHPMMLVDQI